MDNLDYYRTIQDFILRFAAILYEAMPFIILGAIVAGILEEMLPQRLVSRILPRSRFLAIAMGGLLGLIFPMCECGIIPVMRRLLRKGLPLSCCVAYLLAGPIINGVVILSTFVAFSGQESHINRDMTTYPMGSWWMTGLRIGMGYLVAVTTSLIVDWQYRKYGPSLLTPLTRPSTKVVDEEEDSGVSGGILWIAAGIPLLLVGGLLAFHFLLSRPPDRSASIIASGIGQSVGLTNPWQAGWLVHTLNEASKPLPILALVLGSVGVIAALAGLAFYLSGSVSYARDKGYPALLGLIAVTGVGLFVLGLLPYRDREDQTSVWKRLSNISETSLHDFVDITGFLILGALLAAFIRTWLSEETIAELGQQHIVLCILLMMGLAILLCLCSEADAFFAAAFVTLPSSSKLAFLVLGPMMDLKLYMLYTRVFRPRLIFTIFGSVFIQVFLLSIVVHYLWGYYFPLPHGGALPAPNP